MKPAARRLRPLAYMWAMALFLCSGAVYAQQNSAVQRGEPLYADGTISIYANIDNWCYNRDHKSGSGAGLNIVIPSSVAYGEIERWLKAQYGDFPSKVLLPLIRQESCMPRLITDFYKQGNSEYSERVVYDEVKEYSWMNPEYKATIRSPGRSSEARLAEAQKESAKTTIWGGSCTGPFCELQGGGYLNAIYANDVAAIRRMDTQVNDHLKNYMNEQLSELGPLRDMVMERLGPGVKISLLTILADTYLFDYKSGYAFSCPDDLIHKRYEWTNDAYELYNGYGIYMGQGGGETYSADYVLRPEFVPLCDEICDHLGGQSSRWALNNLNHEAARLTLQGLDDMQTKYSCSSPEIRQFERNLMSLTQSYLTNKSSWLTNDNRAQQNQDDPPQAAQPTTPPPANRARNQVVDTTPTPPQPANVSAISERFMAANKKRIGVTVTPSGLQYQILTAGRGAPPKLGDRVTLYYSSATMDGKAYDTTYKSAPFVTNVIYNPAGVKGFIEGLLLVKPGGKIKLFIPPDLAFGDRTFGSLPAGSALIYEIELISINNE